MCLTSGTVGEETPITYIDVCAAQDDSRGYASDFIQEVTASDLGGKPDILTQVCLDFPQTF
jgi:hypothetical protein